MSDRDELIALRRMAELEAKAGPATPTSFAAGVVQGFRDPLDALAQILEHGAKSLGLDTDAINKALGMPSAEESARGATQAFTQTFGGAPGTGGRIVGNMLSLGPLPAMAPIAATTRGAIGLGAATGAATGALQPVEGPTERNLSSLVTGQEPVNFWQEKAKQLLTGAVTGGALGGGISALSRVVSPRVTPQAQMLLNEGVTPTPGQLLGREAARVEQAAESIPFVGGQIKASRQRAINEFNTASLNRVLDTLPGQRVRLQPGADGNFGREAVEAVGQRVSNAYDALLPQLRGRMDQGLQQELTTIRGMATNLPPERATQFENILQDKLLSRFNQHGLMAGETLKQAESELGRLSSMYRRAADPDQRIVGDALLETQAALRRMLQRENPQYAVELRGIDSAYSELLRVERAASSLGAKEGVFTPAQLLNAVKALDPSIRKRQFSRGNALMQDFAEAGETVLGSRLPTSGSAERAMVGAGALGGAAYLEPMTLAAAGLGAAAYTAPAQHLLAAILARRPDVAQPIGAALQNLAVPAGAVAAPAFAPLLFPPQ